MFAIESPSGPSPIVPNLLPAKIKHDGPISIGGRRYWNPQPAQSPSNPASNVPSNAHPLLSKAQQTAYFRGRKLQGRVLRVPKNYHGVILQKTERRITQRDSTVVAGRGAPGLLAAQLLEANDEEEEDDDEDEEDPYRRMLKRQQRQQASNHGAEQSIKESDEDETTHVLETRHTFDEFVVWGHEQTPDEDDAYVRGMEEWINFAETIHTVGEDET